MADLGNNTTHAIVAFFFCITIIAITGVELYYSPNMSTQQLLMIAIQNIGLGFANSWYAGQITISQSGETVTTEPTTIPAGTIVSTQKSVA
jgi:hypothetical protein